MGSGTVSGPGYRENGSLFELNGEPIILSNGEERHFLQDGDSVGIHGICKGPGFVIGFGECQGKITAALNDSEYF